MSWIESSWLTSDWAETNGWEANGWCCAASATPGDGAHWEDWTGAWETQTGTAWEDQQT